ncbi:MAG TPA: S8 family serine peptidase [Thermoanaerobaculia bacterium]|nr:S8 family serine peptidase [Thermoanaerobaculia bacterium]
MPWTTLAAFAIVGILLSAGVAFAQGVSDGGRQQIQALLAEKETRTPAQRKIDSNLLYAYRQSRGLDAAPGVRALATGVSIEPDDATVVDITAVVSDTLLNALQALGAAILDVQPRARSIRARVPLSALETIAADSSVLFIQPKQQYMLLRAPAPSDVVAARSAAGIRVAPKAPPGFTERAARLRAGLAAALGKKPYATNALTVSEGDVTHRANLARSNFGVSGAGVKVGVLSDGVDSLATLQSSGDLPPGVTVLPGQAGSGDEGSAMLEIVHDLAPGAQLYFATADNSIGSFAQNIRDLRAAGCDIIIDDVSYFNESPFQKGQTPSVPSTSNGGVVTQAVDDVTADGALYFSSAANSGSKDAGTSGTWEGDFDANGGAVGAPISGSGTLHDFDPSGSVTAFDMITVAGSVPNLFWSDPLGGSANDYDLFELNSTGSAIVAASTNVQSGTQDPYEQLSGGGVVGDRLVIVRRTGATGRFLHLGTNRGRLSFSTDGETHGHNAPPSANAFGVAATPAIGPFPNPFNSTNVTETFSSDGFRRYFFNADSSAITPGNFSSTGGQLLDKPDVTAADGVSCSAPGFDPFFGTSAAAPHAGAIAALVKSAAPGLTATQVSGFLTSTAIDIMGSGVDRDSGVGILDAFNAVQAATGSAKAVLFVSNAVIAENPGNGNGSVEPGECSTMTVQLTNGNSAAGATGISATLTASTPGVTVFSGTSAYPNIGAGASGTNSVPFTFGLANTVACPLIIDFTLTVTLTGGTSPQAIHFTARAGVPPWTVTTAVDTTTPPTVPGGTSATGTQTDRVFRSGVVSSCAAPKTFPGFADLNSHQFDSYTFTNCTASPVCVKATLTENSGAANAIFLTAYAPTYVPSNPQTSYAADAGISSAVTSLSFTVAGSSSFVIVVSDVASVAGGSGTNYTLTVDGLCLPCTVYSGSGTCAGPTVTPSNTPTFTSTATRTSTFTATPTRTPTFTATSTLTPTRTPTFTASPSPTSTPVTQTPTQSPTSSSTPTRTSTATATPTLTLTPTGGGPTLTPTVNLTLTPGITPTPLADSFYTVAPCRALNTRTADAPALVAGATRTFVLAGAPIGNCTIPGTAKAVSVNITVTQPSTGGDLRLFPGGTPSPPLVSTINYGLGQTRANNAIVVLGPSGDLSVKCDQAFGTVEFILDVNGYFQ